MSFNISNFRSSFTNRGEPQRTSQFEVLIFPPISITSASVAGGLLGRSSSPIGVLSELPMRCSSINLPGKNVLTFDYQQIVGPNLKVANGSVYDELQLEFIMTQSGVERQLLGTWLDFIQPTQLGNMDVKYHDSYTGSIILNLLDQEGKVSNFVTVVNAFPTAMGSVNFAWSDVDRIATFLCSFSFERIEIIAPGSLPEGALNLAPLPEISLSQIINLNTTNIRSSIGF